MLTVMVIPVLVLSLTEQSVPRSLISLVKISLISSKSFGFGTKILTLMVLPRVVRSFQSLVKISNFNKGLGLIRIC